jgi:hypothetical protein
VIKVFLKQANEFKLTAAINRNSVISSLSDPIFSNNPAKAIGPGPHYIDSLSRELSSESAD